MTNNLKTVIEARIEAILGAEKITRVELAELSRELLMYVPDTQDIDMVNRLVGVLTPVNRRAAIHFFSAFLPWEAEKDKQGNFIRFGKRMQGDRKVAKREASMKEFLADKGNNIWTWSDANLQVELKPIDFGGQITRAVKSAIEGNKKREQPGIDKLAILQAVFAGGLTARDFMAYAELLEQRMLEAEAFLAASKGVANNTEQPQEQPEQAAA